MKKIAWTILLTLLTVVMTIFSGAAQSNNSFDVTKDDISDKLPRLSVLIDSALVNNPEMRFNHLQVEINKGNLSTTRKSWTQDLGLQANYGYGTFDYLYNTTSGAQTPPTYTLSQSLQQYGFGAYLRLPLEDLFNHHNLVKTAKAEVSQAQSLVESQQILVRGTVIRQYNDLIGKQQVLKIKAKYLETARINLQMAEKGFTNGTVTIYDYSQVSEIAARTESDFETTKMDFLTTYMLLEEMTGMKFNLFNEPTRR
jgi:outer membrane protein TolC